MITADGLVILLGWDVDDFYSQVRKANADTLIRAKQILSTECEEEPDWIKERSVAGIQIIDEVLKTKTN